MQDTQYGDSAAAKTLLAIVLEQPKVGTANRKVSAFLSDYSHTASHLETISDPHTVIRLQKLWMHTMDHRAAEMFGVATALTTHLRNVLKVRYRAFERRARARIKESKQKKDDCSVCKGAKGGVPGNENIVAGKPVCDYCHADGSFKA